MSRPNDTIWPAVIFVGAWWALGTTRLENHALLLAFALWFVGRAAIKLAGQAVFRLGMRAWWLLLQLAACYVLFLGLATAEWHHKILAIWGIGLPLVMAGGGARLAYERFPEVRVLFQRGALYALGITLLLAPFLLWITGFEMFESRVANLLVAMLAAVSLYYGWLLAALPAHGGHDARFGSAGDYR